MEAYKYVPIRQGLGMGRNIDVGDAHREHQSCSRAVTRSGVEGVAKIVSKYLGAGVPYFVEYSLIQSILGNAKENRLRTFVYGESENCDFLNGIREKYSSIIAASALDGITVYQHPDVFINPKELALSTSFIGGRVDGCALEKTDPSDTLCVKDGKVLGYSEFTRSYREMLHIANTCCERNIQLKMLQLRLHEILHFEFSQGGNSGYVTIPIESGTDRKFEEHQQEGSCRCHGVVFLFYMRKDPLADDVLIQLHDEVADFVRKTSSGYLLGLGMSLLHKAQMSALKSAIGSIMSRNGSHNIGSHVLAALSHNIGTMPDDRVLYQYIQNRMDYIATVTTEPPTWTQPTLLLGNLMRGFLSQYHLLEHIAESEGLRAYEFQKRSGAPDNESNKIELHVRKCSESVVPTEKIEKFWTSSECQSQELIDYSDEHSILLNQDVALAIPGGVVGNHAFYTVLENIIRNAAKHGWSTPPETTAWRKDGNLKIFVDFIETEEDVEFTIWDNMSDVFAGIPDSSRQPDPLSSNVVENKIHAPGKTADLLPLHHRQQVKLAQPFITDSGSLRQENWGLAEMKISVGYLNRREVGAIGGLEKKVNDYKDRSVRIITPVAVKESVDTATSISHLGYRFSVPKPKDIVFVLDNENEPAKTWLNSNAVKLQALRRYGVYFYTIKEVTSKEEKKKRIASQYVVFEDFKEEYLRIGLPFRVLTMSDYPERFRRELIPFFKDFEILKKVVGRLDVKSASEKIKLLVWRCWIDALWRWCRTDEHCNQLSLIINTQGDLSGAGRGLITDRDLLQYVFEHCARSAIRACSNGNGSLSKDGREVLTALIKRSCDASVPEVDSGETLDKLIGLKVLSWLENLKEEPNSRFRLSSYLRREIEHLRMCHKGIGGENLSWNERRQFVRKRIEEMNTTTDMDGLAASLRVAFDQADVFLRKYEEDIATLPTGFRIRSEGTEVRPFAWAVGDDIPRSSDSEEVSVNVCFDRKDATGTTIEYFRHFDPEHSSKPDSALYIEPLSGSQCYMNSVCNIKRDTADVVIVKLLESGLLRVDIADERVAKFCRDHVAMSKTYECLGIRVLDDKDMNLKPADAQVVVAAIMKQLCVSDKSGMRDIFIIHQGLIDKWLEKHGETDVEGFIDKLKKVFRYVVVTTGRGRPANIPPTARVIPFSTVENTLFKKYPEKMVLVDTILNVLPVGPKEAQNDG